MILAGELGSHMPWGQETKTKNRSNVVTNSERLKMGLSRRDGLKLIDLNWKS